MIVSKDQDFLKWVESYRNYGKEVIDGQVYYPYSNGFNFRLSEFNAALGIVQMERLDRILEFKRELAAKYDQIFDNRVRFPDGMISGYYKYIVFNTSLKQETGQVFGPRDLGHVIDETNLELPNSVWITEHHKCAPIYYGYEESEKSVEELKAILLQE